MHWVKVLKLHENARIPEFKSAQAAGADLYACEVGHVAPGHIGFFRSGLAIELRQGTYAEIAPRSSLNRKGVLALRGVIDADYRGELGVLLHNVSHETFFVAPGDRIAQLIVMPLPKTVFLEVDVLSETERGMGEFGSTGK